MKKRILVDTNIMVSAVFAPNSSLAAVLSYVSARYDMLMCCQSIVELWEVICRKTPEAVSSLVTLMNVLNFRIVKSKRESSVVIRDRTDQPILDAAIDAQAGIILTGDKDFLALDLQQPRCMTVAQFTAMEGIDL